MENELDYYGPGVAQQVLPFRLWLQEDETSYFFAPYPSGAFPPNIALGVSTARIHVTGSTVLLTQIALSDGSYLPYAVALRPNASLAPAVRPEALDPRSQGAAQTRPVDFFTFPIFAATESGAGKLLLFVLPELDSSGERATAGELVTRLSQLDDGDADGELAVQIVNAVPNIAASPPSDPVPVGRTFALPFAITLPSPDTHGFSDLGWERQPGLDTATEFTSHVTSLAKYRQLALIAPSRPFQDRWGRTGDTPVPFGVRMDSLYPLEGEADPPLRLIDPARLQGRGQPAGEYGRTRFPQGLGEYGIARRPTTGMVRFSTVSHALPGIEPGVADITVQSTPVTLGLTLTSQDAFNDQIVIEDRWREAEGVLLGGFSVRVSVPGVGSPTGTSQDIYDSDAHMAYISADPAPGEIMIDVVVEEGDPSLFGPFGNNVRRSFRIRATIDDPAVAEFWLPEDAITEAPQRNFMGDLRDIIRAVGPGRAQLTVELVGIEEPLPEECVEYYMPDPQSMVIAVPDPLVARLSSWTDPYFTGSNELTFDRPEREVIYNSGMVTGHVDYHREGSQSERITLEVRPPVGSPREYDWGDGNLTVEPDGDVEQTIGDLAWTQSSGQNLVRLSAWKPINEVVGIGESRAEETLLAVRPAKPQISFASPPGDGASPPRVVRRRLPEVRWTMALATRAELLDDVPTGASVELDSDSVDAYEPRDKTTQQADLAAQTGTHEIEAHAHNDFGTTSSDPLSVVAMAPTVDVTLSVPAGFAGMYRTPNRVGNGVDRVTAEVRLRYAISFQASGPDVDESRTPSNPFQESSIVADLPESPAELEIGDNSFTFEGTNEFGETSVGEVVRRRGEVYDFDEVRVDLAPRGDNRYVTCDVILDGQQIQHFEPTSWAIARLFDGVEMSSPLGFDRIDFQIVRQYGDEFESASAPLFCAIATFGLVGPDYQDVLAYIDLPDSVVEQDDPDNVSIGGGRWLQVVLEDDFGGVIPVGIVDA